jgi:hypothetical protein
MLKRLKKKFSPILLHNFKLQTNEIKNKNFIAGFNCQIALPISKLSFLVKRGLSDCPKR